MRRIVRSAVCVLLLAAAVFFGRDAQAAKGGPSKEVVVYYFHGAGRCATCHKLEAYAREAVDIYFKKEAAAGKVVFNAVNIDSPANEHFVQEYQLFSKAVVLSLVKDGKEVKYKNLTKIWQLVGKKQKYLEYVKGEIEKMLKG